MKPKIKEKKMRNESKRGPKGCMQKKKKKRKKRGVGVKSNNEEKENLNLFHPPWYYGPFQNKHGGATKDKQPRGKQRRPVFTVNTAEPNSELCPIEEKAEKIPHLSCRTSGLWVSVLKD